MTIFPERSPENIRKHRAFIFSSIFDNMNECLVENLGGNRNMKTRSMGLKLFSKNFIEVFVKAQAINSS